MRKAAAVSLVLLLLLVGVAVFGLGDEEEPNSLPLTPLAQVSARPPLARVVAGSPPVAGSSLKLRVSVTEGGKPVAGATVSASDKTGTSDAAGQVVLEVVPGAVALSARWEGRVVHRGLVLSSLLGDQHVTLAFEDGQVLELSVLDSKTGQPLAGARVELQVEAELAQRPATVVLTSDGAGHVNLSGFKMDEFELTVSHPGYVTAFAYVDERELEVRLEPNEPFTGRVLMPDGKPAAGATVTTSSGGIETTTSRDGTFSLVHARGNLCARLGELEAIGSVEDAKEDGLVLAKVPSFAGQVFSSVDDQPLEGVRVRTNFGSLEAATVTDREGNFLIPGLCAAGDSPLATFELAGYVTGSAVLEIREKNVVRLSGRGALRGIVIDEQGVGVEGALVTARDTITLTEQEAKTDADGRFSFESVKRELAVSAVLNTRSISQDVIVEAGQLVEMTLPISGERMSVPVEVLQEGKRAPRTCMVTARRIDGPALEETIEWGYRVRGLGRGPDAWFIRLPVGSYKVTASNAEFTGETEFRVQKGEVQPALRIHVVAKPPPTVYPIRVQVLSSQNVPVAGVRVTAQTCGAAARTDAEGRTVCEMVGPQMQMISASLGGASASFQVTDWSDEVVLRLPPGVTIRGHVAGELRPELEVLVLSKDGSGSAQVTSKDFVLVDQPATRSVLCLLVGEERLGCTVVVPEGRREVDMTIPIGAPGELRLTVIDSSGQQVLDPVLYLDRRTIWRGTVDGVVKTALAPGDHVLVVNVDGTAERYEALFKVEPGLTTDLGRVQLR